LILLRQVKDGGVESHSRAAKGSQAEAPGWIGPKGPDDEDIGPRELELDGAESSWWWSRGANDGCEDREVPASSGGGVVSSNTGGSVSTPRGRGIDSYIGTGDPSGGGVGREAIIGLTDPSLSRGHSRQGNFQLQSTKHRATRLETRVRQGRESLQLQSATSWRLCSPDWPQQRLEKLGGPWSRLRPYNNCWQKSRPAAELSVEGGKWVG